MQRSLGIDSGIASLLDRAPNEVLDYGFVMECLKEYNNPRVKLNHLLKIEALIRVKKGIYIFGKNLQGILTHQKCWLTWCTGPLMLP